MNREQMIEKVRDEVGGWPIGSGYYGTSVSTDEARDIATLVVDALLPQVATVEELEALPFDTKVVDANGEVWARYYLAAKGMRPLRWRNSRGGYGKTSLYLADNGPLPVVWQP